MGRTPLAKRGLQKRPKSELTDKERRFITEYNVDYNATRAATAAGYKSPKAVGSQLLSKPKIMRELGNLSRKTAEKCELTAEEILLQLYYCCTRSAADFCDKNGKIITDVHRLSRRAQNTIDAIEQTVYVNGETGDEVIKTKLRLVPKMTAIQAAMEHKGLFAPVEHEITTKIDWEQMYQDGKDESQGDDVGDVEQPSTEFEDRGTTTLVKRTAG